MNKIARSWKVNLPTPLSTSTRPVLSRTSHTTNSTNSTNGKVSKITLQRIQEREQIENEKREKEEKKREKEESERIEKEKKEKEEKKREKEELERIRQIEKKRLENEREYNEYKIIIDIVLTTQSTLNEDQTYGIPLFTLRIPRTYRNQIIEEIIYQLESHLQSVYKLYQETGMICLSLSVLIDRAKRHFLDTPIDIQKHISLQFEEFIMDDIADWDNSYLSFIYRRGNEIRHIHSFYK